MLWLRACERMNMRPFAAEHWDQLTPGQQELLVKYDVVRAKQDSKRDVAMAGMAGMAGLGRRI